MTIFKSRQVNLDPEPWIGWDAEVNGERRSGTPFGYAQFKPRPEFEPTRDPLPYFDTESDDDDPLRLPHKVHDPTNSVVWKPRRDQFDTPVNPILVAFRGVQDNSDESMRYEASEMLADLDNGTWHGWDDVNSDHIAHARLVLGRLSRLASLA